MDKLTMCRICLVENVRMYVVVDKNMHELYEKLTDIPFVTEDSRPMLSCFICYTKLKQCCQLQRTCLAAEELLAQMINEPNPSITRGPLEYCNGLIKTPIQSISIVDFSQIKSITIKEEFPAAYDRQDGVMEPKQENPQDDVELKYENYGYSDEKDIPLQDSESDGDNVPLIEFKTEEEEGQEVSRKRRASDTRSVPATNKPKPDPHKDSNHSLSPKHENKVQEHSKTSENTTINIRLPGVRHSPKATRYMPTASRIAVGTADIGLPHACLSAPSHVTVTALSTKMAKPRNYCAVDGCKSQKTNDNLSFFSLPRDEQRRRTWLEIIGRPDLMKTQTKLKSHVVCSLHFDKSMIKNIPQLKADAIPTKSLQNQPGTSNHNTNEGFKNESTQTKESFINILSAATIKTDNTTQTA